MRLAICVLTVITQFACKQPKTREQPASVAGQNPSGASSADLNPLVLGALKRQLNAAVSAKGPNYQPRTRHKNQDGSAKYTNRLIRETSPYLIQHAHNPVNWFPWGPEALRFARELQRPIFLSVGYSTCHWCHVMEEESFEDEEIAEYLNRHYIPIKVDREERPDIDSIYMTAVQLLTRRGGWPMSVWLTPKLEPFFGGTYFPARTGDRGSRAGFLTLLKQHQENFKADPNGVAARAQELVERIQQAMRPSSAGDISEKAIEGAIQRASQRFDARFGGTQGAPKFPSSFPIRLLLRHGRFAKNEKSKRMAVETLAAIGRGGIYDHVGGGFHRYSTDRRWLVPHFEKMLYDNAQLVLAYLEALQLSDETAFEHTARETLDYVAREMTAPEGGFYSATDADSLTPQGHREEGYYFTWTPVDLKKALSQAENKLVTQVYGVTSGGNFEGRNILSLSKPLNDLARELGLAESSLRAQLDPIKRKLRSYRDQRPKPIRDDKIQTSWNGLMLSAFARGAQVLAEPKYLEIATKGADFLLSKLRVGGRLQHSLLGNTTSSNAFLADYAFFAGGLLDTFEASQNRRYLVAAIALMQELEKYHADAVEGGYFMTPSDWQPLLVREKPDYDKAIPNGNSWAFRNQLKLHLLTGNDIWRQRAETTLRAFGSQLRSRPSALSEMLLGLDWYLGSPKQILIIIPEQAEAGAEAQLLNTLRGEFFPNRVLIVGKPSQLAKLHEIPWISDKPARNGMPTVYVCEQGACQLPTGNPAVFRSLLQQATALEGRR